MVRVINLPKEVTVGATMVMDGQRWTLTHLGDVDGERRALLTCIGKSIQVQSLLVV
jgi:hypothetical protein